jgi:hypothetical protein
MDEIRCNPEANHSSTAEANKELQSLQTSFRAYKQASELTNKLQSLQTSFRAYKQASELTNTTTPPRLQRIAEAGRCKGAGTPGEGGGGTVTL